MLCGGNKCALEEKRAKMKEQRAKSKEEPTLWSESRAKLA